MLIKDLEKLRKRTLRERIYEEIVHLILSGELPSGGWVDEKQVIHKLRVSRTPFREAIGILAKGGLVEIRPYRGFYDAQLRQGPIRATPLENPITNIG
jgi:DNA-binding GntR family transcriptional regulator